MTTTTPSGLDPDQDRALEKHIAALVRVRVETLRGNVASFVDVAELAEASAAAIAGIRELAPHLMDSINTDGASVVHERLWPSDVRRWFVLVHNIGEFIPFDTRESAETYIRVNPELNTTLVAAEDSDSASPLAQPIVDLLKRSSANVQAMLVREAETAAAPRVPVALTERQRFALRLAFEMLSSPDEDQRADARDRLEAAFSSVDFWQLDGNVEPDVSTRDHPRPDEKSPFRVGAATPQTFHCKHAVEAMRWNNTDEDREAFEAWFTRRGCGLVSLAKLPSGSLILPNGDPAMSGEWVLWSHNEFIAMSDVFFRAEYAAAAVKPWLDPNATAAQIRTAIIEAVGVMVDARMPEMQQAYDDALRREGLIDGPLGPGKVVWKRHTPPGEPDRWMLTEITDSQKRVIPLTADQKRVFTELLFMFEVAADLSVRINPVERVQPAGAIVVPSTADIAAAEASRSPDPHVDPDANRVTIPLDIPPQIATFFQAHERRIREANTAVADSIKRVATALENERGRTLQLVAAREFDRYVYRTMISDLLASASPSEREHPTMWKQWERARHLLEHGPQILPHPLDRPCSICAAMEETVCVFTDDVSPRIQIGELSFHEARVQSIVAGAAPESSSDDLLKHLTSALVFVDEWPGRVGFHVPSSVLAVLEYARVEVVMAIRELDSSMARACASRERTREILAQRWPDAFAHFTDIGNALDLGVVTEVDLASVVVGSLADDILRFVHAFGDKGRRDAVRALARRVLEMERSHDQAVALAQFRGNEVARLADENGTLKGERDLVSVIGKDAPPENLVDRVIYELANVHDTSALWGHLRDDPDAFRVAVKHAFRVHLQHAARELAHGHRPAQVHLHRDHSASPTLSWQGNKARCGHLFVEIRESRVRHDDPRPGDPGDVPPHFEWAVMLDDDDKCFERAIAGGEPAAPRSWCSTLEDAQRAAELACRDIVRAMRTAFGGSP